MTKRVILFTGLGGDSRLMAPIKLAGFEVVTPDHDPLADESLAAYARRVADRLAISKEDVIGGASFGGMLAAEIAAQRAVAGLLLLGTCTQPSRLPRLYRLIEAIGQMAPDAAITLRTWKPLHLLVHNRFAPMTPEGEELLLDMAKVCQPEQLRRLGRMIMSWPGVETHSCPALSIHGDKDRIIPITCVEPDVTFADAGHCFTLTHASETIGQIARFLATL